MKRVKGQGSKVKGLIVLSILSFAFLKALYADTETLAHVEKLFLEGRYEKVIYETGKLIDAKSGQRDELYYIKGLSELKTNRFKDARESFEKIITKFQASRRTFDAYTGIGDSYFLEGNIKDAIRAYEDIINKFPNDKNISSVYYRLSNCYKKIALEEKTKEYLDMARRASPLSFEARTLVNFNAEPVRANSKAAVSNDKYNNFSVQAGCFKNRTNARKLAEKLNSRNYDSYVETLKDDGALLYRVKVGRYNTRDEAKKMSSKLNSLGYTTRVCSNDLCQ